MKKFIELMLLYTFIFIGILFMIFREASHRYNPDKYEKILKSHVYENEKSMQKKETIRIGDQEMSFKERTPVEFPLLNDDFFSMFYTLEDIEKMYHNFILKQDLKMHMFRKKLHNTDIVNEYEAEQRYIEKLERDDITSGKISFKYIIFYVYLPGLAIPFTVSIISCLYRKYIISTRPSE